MTDKKRDGKTSEKEAEYDGGKRECEMTAEIDEEIE